MRDPLRRTSEVVRVDVIVRGENGIPTQTASIVRALRDVRCRRIRYVGMTEARYAARPIVPTRTTSIEPRDLIADIFRRNEVMQMRV
jgi:hypothetical protein